MYLSLIEHIGQFVALDHDQTNILLTYLDHHVVAKKEHLLREGQICNAQYFIEKGCFRQYVIGEKDGEQTIQFGIENDWMTDFMSFQLHAPSNFCIQAIEKSKVISIQKEALEDLLVRVPQLERYFRVCMQKSFGASQARIKYLYTMGAEERYQHISNLFPDFVQRIPKDMLGSYLDFTPEFISKISARNV